MKKILLTATLLVTSTLLFSQTKFGVKAGANFATIQVNSEESGSYAPESITSFNFGGFAEVHLNSTLYFQPGLSISGKGYKVDYSVTGGGVSESINSTVKLLYLEAPINFIAKFNAGSGKFVAGGGPYLGYGISGKIKGEYKIDAPGTDGDFSMPTNADVEFGDNEEEIKPFDFGFNLLAGYE